MLSKKRIGEYLAERFSKIHQHYAEFILFQRQADLHKFRVEIKKVKAVAKLIRYQAGNRQVLIEFIPLKHVFKMAGYIRNIYIEICLLEKHELAGSKTTKQKTVIMQTKITDFVAKAAAYQQSVKAAEKGIMRCIEDIKDEDIMRYMEKLVEKTGIRLNETGDKESIHDARIFMKQIIYTYELLNKRIRGNLTVNIDFINTLQDMIGQWHDADMAYGALEKQRGMNKKTLQSIQDDADRLGTQIARLIIKFEQASVQPQDKQQLSQSINRQTK